MQTMLVSDIGGTNGRFAIARFEQGKSLPVIEHTVIYACEMYDGFVEMLRNYLAQLPIARPTQAQFAIAGPTGKREGVLTNLGWAITAEELEQEFGFDSVSFLNDFAALAYSILYLEEGDFFPVTTTKGDPALGPISILGPGTGFGLALAIPTPAGWHVVPTEGGHMDFSVNTPLERDLVAHLKKEYDHVSVEHLLSGLGLQRIHQFLVSYGGSGDASLSPAEISMNAKNGTVPSCERAVQLFMSILGSVAGDIALAHGAKGGVYIGGGILPKMGELVNESDLVARFQTKSKMSEYLKAIPIKIVTSETSALLGAALAKF